MNRIDYQDGRDRQLACGQALPRSAIRPNDPAMAPRLTSEARALLRRQRNVLADWQAHAVGLNRRRLLRATSDGWSQVSPHVFAAFDTEAAPEQLRMAGLLEAGPGSALAGCSALVESGWRGSERGIVDVHTLRGRRHRFEPLPSWLRLHHPHDEPAAGGLPPRTRAARAALDAASWARSDREAVMVLASSVQQGLTQPRHLERELAAGQRRRAACIRDALMDLSEGATSSNEIVFLRQCRARSLPRPRMQTNRVGGRRRTDAEFRMPNGRLLIVEIDGIGHLDVSSWHSDVARHNELAVDTGALILRVTGWEVRNDPDPFFDLLASLFHESW